MNIWKMGIVFLTQKIVLLQTEWENKLGYEIIGDNVMYKLVTLDIISLQMHVNVINRKKRNLLVSFFLIFLLERGTRFELAHPRVEALVHSLFYVTLASEKCGGIIYKSIF